jgi:hypothetical protein
VLDEVFEGFEFFRLSNGEDFSAAVSEVRTHRVADRLTCRSELGLKNLNKTSRISQSNVRY